MIEAGCKASNLSVADNSLTLSSTVSPDEKSYCEEGILYIGRLRENCQIDLLIEAVAILRGKGHKAVLHIIGGGSHLPIYKNRYANDDWIIWHGDVYTEAEIATISKNCRFGCYPGDAGLSVVHMFGLSLPPLIHSSIHEHMGPEPSYVASNINGFHFLKNGKAAAIAEQAELIWNLDSHILRNIAVNSYQKYLSLNTPSLGIRFLRIIKGEKE
jgi:glycosyltransferase involved in cell wall biosynthesis